MLTSTSYPRTKFGAQLQCVTGPQSAPGQVTLEISYGGSRVPSPGVSFTYCENPVLRAFEPLRSFVRCDPSPL
jgi:plexin B